MKNMTRILVLIFLSFIAACNATLIQKGVPFTISLTQNSKRDWMLISKDEVTYIRNKQDEDLDLYDKKVLSHYNSWRSHFYDVDSFGNSRLSEIWWESNRPHTIARGCLVAGLLLGIPTARGITHLNTKFPRLFPTLGSLSFLSVGGTMATIPFLAQHPPSEKDRMLYYPAMIIAGTTITGGLTALKKIWSR